MIASVAKRASGASQRGRAVVVRRGRLLGWSADARSSREGSGPGYFAAWCPRSPGPPIRLSLWAGRLRLRIAVISTRWPAASPKMRPSTEGCFLGDHFEGRAAIRSLLEDWFGTYEELEFGLEEVRDLGRVAPAATLQRPLLAVRFAVELRLDAPRFAAELRFAAEFAAPPELRSFCSRSRSRSTALFIFSRSRRASRRSFATSLRRSLPPVRTLPRIAPSSFSVVSSAFLMRAIARPFCSKRARAAAVTRAPAAGFLAAALREDDALRVVVFRALALLVGGIDAPCLGSGGRSIAELLTIRGARREDGGDIRAVDRRGQAGTAKIGPWQGGGGSSLELALRDTAGQLVSRVPLIGHGSERWNLEARAGQDPVPAGRSSR